MTLALQVEQRRWAGTELDPPRRLMQGQVQVSPDETVLRISTDDGVLGHACAETFHISVSLANGDGAEFEITESQGSQGMRVIRGLGWRAKYPEMAGPGLRIEYCSLHSYLD